VVEKVFMTSIPTVVVWDGVEPTSSAPKNEAEDDDVWDDMENVEDDDDDDDDNEQRRKRRRNIVMNED
jgi:ribosome biogenesis protein NSA1